RPATAEAVTYAVGKVFHQHFASGGTFLTFDPDKVREYYAQMLKEGKAMASKAKASVSTAG
ncbi:MAG: GTPase, partial [Candidatus Electrothrix sp. GM3_4]|nr:GTPase [Candidatus Electrothrix sp. GM3_4]